ncbi:hypothetical protein ABZ215_25225 [Amycolatopsis sp. NPDC006131]|uniref:hypothetical protein n=1 Tax=Amycolatopsis sp. NPDC006131 TaxID=3156731 RepID=UPI0033B6C482
MVNIVPSAKMERRRYGAGKLWVAPLGTITSNYTPQVTGGAFVQGTTATQVPGASAWLPVGITTEGTRFTSSSDTDTDESAEYYYPHATVVTGQTCGLEVELKTVNLTNLRVALNAATSQVSGTPTASSFARLAPPLPGQEVRMQWLWESNAADMIIVLYKGLNTGDVELAAQKGAGGMNVPLSISGELPDASVAPTPYDILVCGNSFAESTATE